MVDLNSLAPDSPLYLFTACSINSRGEIIGLALDADGNFHGYLATPKGGRPSGVKAGSACAGKPQPSSLQRKKGHGNLGPVGLASLSTTACRKHR
jgi:hypothetical protein